MSTKHVVVLPYDKQWKQCFLQIKNELQNALGNLAMRIEHVGSTSVQGLSAKPIIDIDVVIKDYSVFEDVVSALATIGYRYEGNLGIEGREAFKYDDKAHLLKHHLYVCPQDSAELKRHIAFRDYLRSNPDAVREYSRIKEEGAKLFPYDIDKYIEYKTPFIESVYTEIFTEKIIETERLFLREMRDSDFDALYAVLADKDIMGHYPYTFDEKRVREWIQRNIDRYRENGFGLWAVCLKDTGEMIGDCGLTLQTMDGKVLPEIGYHIRRDCQKKGYAKEAAQAVCDWAFENTDYPALYSYCKYTNVASYKTAESIGMHFEKEYPDEVNEFTHVSVIYRPGYESTEK